MGGNKIANSYLFPLNVFSNVSQFGFSRLLTDAEVIGLVIEIDILAWTCKDWTHSLSQFTVSHRHLKCRKKNERSLCSFRSSGCK